MEQIIKNEKSFNATIKAIAKNSEELAQSIHNAGMFAIAQANEHGNIGFASRLLEALGRKHDAQRVVNWLVKFGKVGVKDGAIVYRARKDIGPENMDATLTKADNTPYWILTAQKKLVQKVDYLAMLNALVKRHESVSDKIAAGETIEESNVQVLEEVKALLARIGAPQAAEVGALGKNDTMEVGVAAGC